PGPDRVREDAAARSVAIDGGIDEPQPGIGLGRQHLRRAAGLLLAALRPLRGAGQIWNDRDAAVRHRLDPLVRLPPVEVSALALCGLPGDLQPDRLDLA